MSDTNVSFNPTQIKPTLYKIKRKSPKAPPVVLLATLVELLLGEVKTTTVGDQGKP